MPVISGPASVQESGRSALRGFQRAEMDSEHLSWSYCLTDGLSDPVDEPDSFEEVCAEGNKDFLSDTATRLDWAME